MLGSNVSGSACQNGIIDPRAAFVTLALIPYSILDLHWIDNENVFNKLNQSYKLAIFLTWFSDG